MKKENPIEKDTWYSILDGTCCKCEKKDDKSKLNESK
jgi:hypothetical protein